MKRLHPPQKDSYHICTPAQFYDRLEAKAEALDEWLVSEESSWPQRIQVLSCFSEDYLKSQLVTKKSYPLPRNPLLKQHMVL